MPDFNIMNPPKSVTDPSYTGGTTPRQDPFPAHVHAEDGSYVVVYSEDEMATQLKTGRYKKQPWPVKK
jgi:hypothetical protein